MDSILPYAFRRIARHLNFDIVRYKPPKPEFPTDFTQQDIDIIRAVQPYTMTSAERLFALIQAVRYVVSYNIPGAISECGVWRGGSMMAVARVLLQMHHPPRHLYLFDTFEGMPPPSMQDIDFRGTAAATILQNPDAPNFERVRAYATLDEVRANMHQTGYDPAYLHFIQGKVEATIPAQAPDTIALLRLDTDWYESTLHELEHLFPRLAPHGVLIIDDYGHWRGCHQATDEYIARSNVPILLNRIDYTGRIAVKSG